MNPTRLFAAVLLMSAPFTACDCSEDPLTRSQPPDERVVLDAGFPPVNMDASFVPDAEEPPDSGPEARVLEFDGTSPVTIYFGASRDLRFILKTVSGALVAGETIQLALSGTAGMIGATSAVTDMSGAGAVRFNAGLAAASGTLTASAELAAPVMVEIIVVEDPAAELTIDVASAARIPVRGAEAAIYVGPAASVPSCAALLAAPSLPAPTLMASFSAVPGSSSFNGLASGSMVTAFATGVNAAGELIARGCTEGVRLAGASNTHLLVTLEQLPSQLAGDYDALLHLDVGATIPPPLGPTIVLITDFMADPAGWVVYQTLALFDQNFGSSFVMWQPAGAPAEVLATFPEVRANPSQFPTWTAARNSLHNFLVTQLGAAYVDVTTVAGDISRLIRSFEVGAGYTLTSTGTVDRLEVVESWKAVVFQWQGGCAPGDLGCARRAYELSGPHAHLAPAEATYGATVVHAPLAPPGDSERFILRLDAHEITLRYGAMIILMLDEIVFPNLPPAIAGNSLTEVLGNIVDCVDVGIQLEAATGFPAALFEGACNSGVAAAAAYIENQILQLDSTNNPGLVVGLSPNGGGELVLVDHDQDLVTELVASVTTYASWSNGAGAITPITGWGRERASDCGSDSDCPSGRWCVPIGSYLEVRALEQDCRKPVGMMGAVSPCSADADCASGICFDSGGGSRICFTACDDPAACGSMTCAQDAVPVSLDPILAGLGSATTNACVP